MLKDFFINEVEAGVKEAVNAGKLGQMSEYSGGLLTVEKPKNPEFGDFAVNVSPLARSAKIAPPVIAAAIVEFLPSKTYNVSVVGGFINFKIKEEILSDIISEILSKKENYARKSRY